MVESVTIRDPLADDRQNISRINCGISGALVSKMCCNTSAYVFLSRWTPAAEFSSFRQIFFRAAKWLCPTKSFCAAILAAKVLTVFTVSHLRDQTTNGFNTFRPGVEKEVEKRKVDCGTRKTMPTPRLSVLNLRASLEYDFFRLDDAEIDGGCPSLPNEHLSF